MILNKKEKIFQLQVDAKLNTISSCNYDGSNRRIILYSVDTLKHPFSITTFEDWVYWTDWDKAAVFKANKFTGKDVQAVTAVQAVFSPTLICDSKKLVTWFNMHFILTVEQSNGHPCLSSLPATGRDQSLCSGQRTLFSSMPTSASCGSQCSSRLLCLSRRTATYAKWSYVRRRRWAN